MKTFRGPHDPATPANIAPEVASLLHEAGNPYFDWFFGDAERARTVIERWLLRPDSEVSMQRVVLLLVDERIAGMFVGLDGAALARCRMADALAALREAGRSPADRALLRTKLAGPQLFAPVSRDEFYLSKLAVVPEMRGRGLGHDLLDAFLAAGRAAGCRRSRLDVAASNHAAIRLYRSAGFVACEERAKAGLRYVAMARDEDARLR